MTLWENYSKFCKYNSDSLLSSYEFSLLKTELGFIHSYFDRVFCSEKYSIKIIRDFIGRQIMFITENE